MRYYGLMMMFVVVKYVHTKKCINPFLGQSCGKLDLLLVNCDCTVGMKVVRFGNPKYI